MPKSSMPPVRNVNPRCSRSPWKTLAAKGLAFLEAVCGKDRLTVELDDLGQSHASETVEQLKSFLRIGTL
jgi:hypothetical protein